MVSVFTIRSDNYEPLQIAKSLEEVTKVAYDLGPMPKGSYAEVIKGPAQRLERTRRALKIDDAVVEALLADIDSGGAKDALPLLAFTLERLYGEYGATGHLKLEHYEKLGRMRARSRQLSSGRFGLPMLIPRCPRTYRHAWRCCAAA
jgi:hypothetical protein